MQTKFKISEVFNNGDFKICQDSYKTVRAGRVNAKDNERDYLWKCPSKKCQHYNQRSYYSAKDYIAWLDECSSCHERVFIKKSNDNIIKST